jgi:hypothetical protein
MMNNIADYILPLFINVVNDISITAIKGTLINSLKGGHPILMGEPDPCVFYKPLIGANSP